jgi:hypothetical protein
MALDISHCAWKGSCGTFMDWRRWIARQIGIPLDLMEGYYYDSDIYPNIFTLLDCIFPNNDEIQMARIRRDLKPMLPLKWSDFKPNVLHKLLCHSDCEGYLGYSTANKIAIQLEKILQNIERNETNEFMYKRTLTFIEGCKLAYSKKERLEFRG